MGISGFPQTLLTFPKTLLKFRFFCLIVLGYQFQHFDNIERAVLISDLPPNLNFRG